MVQKILLKPIFVNSEKEILNKLKTSLKASVCIFTISLFTHAQANATIFNSAKDGNWDATATWAATDGSDADGIPDSDDIVIIKGKTNVLVTTNASCASLRINNDSKAASLTISGTNTLTVIGAVTVMDPSAANFQNTLDIGDGTLYAGTMEIKRDLGAAKISIGTNGHAIISGSTSVEGSLTASNTNLFSIGAGSLTASSLTLRGETSITTNLPAGAATATITTGEARLTGNLTIENPPSASNQTNLVTLGSGLITTDEVILEGGNGTSIGKLSVADGLVISTTDVDFNGINPINAVLDLTGPATLKVGGKLNNFGIFNAAATSTVIFNGSATQIIPKKFTFGNIEIANSSLNGAKLSGDVVFGNGTVARTGVKGNIRIVSGILSNEGFTMSGSSNKLSVLESGTLALTGNTNFPAGFTNEISQNSTVSYQGADQTIKDLPYSNLKISGTGTKTLASNITISGTLNLANGKLDVGNFILTLENTAAVTNASSSSYIKLGNTGKLRVKNLGAGGRSGQLFLPIGNATSYTPAYLTNTGPADDFSVNVVDGLKINNINATTNVVLKTWNITQETTNGTPDVTLKLLWNESDQASPFNPAAAAISLYSNNSWDQPAYRSATLESGAAPNRVFSLTRNSISNLTSFGIGDNNSPLASNTPLPVELVYFKATKKGESALLEWETATEKNNQGFEIQLSADGKNFERIAFVESRNPNSHTTQRYAFTDAQQSKTGLWYYRIKQTDIDGTVAFYGPKVIDFGKAKDIVTAYPNPFSEQFQIKLVTNEATDALITLFDLTGKMVYNSIGKLNQGNNLIQVNLSNGFKPGLYLLQVKSAEKVYSGRVIKQ